MSFKPSNHSYQWDHPALDIVVCFFIDADFIEVDHVFGYVYGEKCIADLFYHDRLIRDFQRSPDYDEYLERRRA